MIKFLGYITKALIIIILLSNVYILSFLEKNDYFSNSGIYENSLGVNERVFILGALMLLESLIILFFIQKVYESPIRKLELAIKNFLYGGLKNKEIKLDKSLNPHINFILSFFNKTLNTLKNIKGEFLHGKQIKSEVELGKEIQDKLLTKKIIEVPSLNIVAKSKPAAEIGGDSYDIIKNNDNYYIYVGDATGHGVGAGFIMMMINALISGFSKVYKKGNDILGHTNQIIKPRIKANLLMTLLMIRWNEKEKKLFFTGAGHEYLLIYKQKTKKCFKIKSGGIAIGMIKDIHKILKEKQIEFEKNDIIILYSDGITEAINRPEKDGKELMFGEDRLIESIENTPNIKNKNYKSAKGIFKNITIDLSKFMGYKHTQLDDITLVVVEYKSDDYNIIEDYSEDIEYDFITEWNW